VARVGFQRGAVECASRGPGPCSATSPDEDRGLKPDRTFCRSLGTISFGGGTHPALGLSFRPFVDRKWIAAPPQKRRLSPRRRYVLEVIARSPDGATWDLLIVVHGISRDTIAGLVRVGLQPCGTKLSGPTARRPDSSAIASRTRAGWRSKGGRLRSSTQRPKDAWNATLWPALDIGLGLANEPHAAPALLLVSSKGRGPQSPYPSSSSPTARPARSRGRHR
jgi:hypothetical protein